MNWKDHQIQNQMPFCKVGQGFSQLWFVNLMLACQLCVADYHIKQRLPPGKLRCATFMTTTGELQTGSSLIIKNVKEKLKTKKIIFK